MSKICFKCGIKKQISEYYCHDRMADGHLNKCKDCTKKDVHERFKKDPEKLRAYDRKRANEPHRLAARKEYAETDQGRLATKKAKTKWDRENRFKKNAHLKTQRVLKKGILIKTACEVCGHDDVEGHHPDYSKPLQVMWLCSKHPADWHKRDREEKRQAKL